MEWQCDRLRCAARGNHETGNSSDSWRISPARSTRWSIEKRLLLRSFTMTRTKECPRLGMADISPGCDLHSPQLTDLVLANASTLSASSKDSTRMAVCSRARPGVPGTETRDGVLRDPVERCDLLSWLQDASTASRSTTCEHR